MNSTITKFMSFAKGYFADQVKVTKKSADWDMEEFEEKLNEFSTTVFEQGQKNAPKRGAKKESTGPKKPKSAYIFFCSAKRNEAKEELGEEVKNTDILKRLGEMWRELSDEDKEEYTEMATNDKERYAEEAEEAGIEPKTPKTKKKSSPSRGVSGYVIFCGEHRAEVQEEMKGEKPTEVTRRLGAMWRELGTEGQEEWNNRAQEEREKLKSDAEDDEPKTPKTKSKKSKAAPKTKSKKSADEEDEDVDPKTPKTKSKKSKPVVDSDEEDEPKTKSKSKKTESKKAKPVADEEDEPKTPKTKKAESKKSAVPLPKTGNSKKPKPVVDSDEEDSPIPSKKTPSRVLPIYNKKNPVKHDDSDLEEDD